MIGYLYRGISLSVVLDNAHGKLYLLRRPYLSSNHLEPSSSSLKSSTFRDVSGPSCLVEIREYQ